MMKKLTLKSISIITTLLILISLSAPMVFAQPPQKSIQIFYPNGDWQYVPTVINVNPNQDLYVDALNSLINGKSMPQECYNEFPKGTKVKNFELIDTIAFVDINRLLIDKMEEKGLSTDIVREILCYNIFNLNDKITEINFTFDGSTVNNFSKISKEDYFKQDQQTDMDKLVQEKMAEVKEKVKGMTAQEIREFIKNNSKKDQSTESMSVAATATTYKVCVDPGHGGSDPGAVRTYNGVTYYEKDLNLSIANYLKTYLGADAISVVMTRTTDTKVELSTRYTIANNSGANCFVSVHLNSVTNTSVKGTTAIYPNNHDITTSADLASEVHSMVVATTSLTQYTAPYKDTRDLAVLRNTKMPAIITETGFMSNNTDIAYLIKAANREAIGAAIEIGIYWWLGLC